MIHKITVSVTRIILGSEHELIFVKKDLGRAWTVTSLPLKKSIKS